MFKRRVELSTAQKIREFFWPRAGWGRFSRYIWHRVVRIKASPHSIALGFFWGSFISYSPFMGLHFVIAAMLAWFTRSNIVASAIGTAVGNPISFPFIWALTYNLGNLLLGRESEDPQGPSLVEMEPTDYLTGDLLYDTFLPMLVGGLLPGVLFSLPFYFVIRSGVRAYQARRAKKLEAGKARREGAGVK